MRYTRPKNYHSPDRTRTRPIKGEWDDEGVWYRCQHCGFVCKLGRDELGKESNVSYTRTYKDEALMDETGCVSCGGEILDESGAAIDVENLDVFMSDVNTGCPFCGSTNWKRQ